MVTPDTLTPPVKSSPDEAPAAPPAVGSRRLRQQRRQAITLVAPAMTLIGLFVFAPVLVVFGMAFFTWDPFSLDGELVGLSNFARVLTSDDLQRTALNTVFYAAMTVPTTLGLGTLCAVCINSVPRWRGLFRTALFLPVISTLAAMGVVWRWMFYPEAGLIDRLLGTDGWLSDTALSLPAVAVVGNWSGLGVVMIIALAAISTVPTSQLEAAQLDGAGAWTSFWYVTWPAIRPAMLFAAVITTRNALQVFDTVRVMTDGGPLGSSQTLLHLLWQRGIEYADMGGAAVITLVVIFVVLVVALVQYGLLGGRGSR